MSAVLLVRGAIAIRRRMIPRRQCIFGRIGLELGLATGTTEQHLFAVVLAPVRGVGLRKHAANRVAFGLSFSVVAARVMGVRVHCSSTQRAALLVSLESQLAPSHNGKVNTEKFANKTKVNISEAAGRSGVSAKMIRYYESVGLLQSAPRRANGYRDYGDSEVAMLQFERRTRDLGFSLEEVGALLALWRDRGRSSREVRRLAEKHLADIGGRMTEMRAVSRTLKQLVHACHGDDRPDCPILDDLAAPRTKARRTKR